jgi:hypothetical protein
MLRSTLRGGRWPLALMLAGVAACADEPAAPRIPVVSRPNANLGDVITVTTTSGTNDVGSLRWAVAQTTGGEIIRFAPALAGATIVVDTTVLVNYAITIEGPADKGVTISGGNAHHIFEVTYGLTSPTTFRNLSLVNGLGSGSAGGGAIVSSSDIVLENMTLSNHTGTDWAAFYTNANATFINTTISNNNTTTPGRYGAAFAAKKLTLVNSTIAYNNNGGVDARGSLAIRNSIITHNGAGPNCNYVPSFERAGRNLADDSSCGDSTVMLIAPAKLDSLRNNGGPGRTHALLGASPAINAGKDCTVTVDQRYVTRDATCDLGAFEFKDFTTATITNNATLPVDPTTGLVFVAGTVKCSTDDAFDLAVEVTQEQKSGRSTTVVKAAGKVSVSCSTSAKPWGVALAPSSGSFEIGNAVVVTKTDAAPWVTPATTSTPVKLYRGRK